MVEVISTGFYSTIQDMGRRGYHEFGVPYSGAMDMQSAKLANALLNNPVNSAVIEATMTGPKLHFKKDTLICITGANMSPKLNKKQLQLNKSIQVNEGDVLSFGRLQYGFRSYIAVAGGFQTQTVMNSRSMYQHITSQIMLQKGDSLPMLNLDKTKHASNAFVKVDSQHFDTEILPVYKSPEFDHLTTNQQEALLSQTFTVSKDNNRMAYQLDLPISNTIPPIITSLTLPGTVQLPPSGKLIVLMRDGQTAGGYPRVLQLTETAINRLSQKFTGQDIRFQLTE